MSIQKKFAFHYYLLTVLQRNDEAVVEGFQGVPVIAPDDSRHLNRSPSPPASSVSSSRISFLGFSIKCLTALIALPVISSLTSRDSFTNNNNKKESEKGTEQR